MDDIVEKLDCQDQLVREIDSFDVTAWPAKYHVWLGLRKIMVEVQEVGRQCQIHTIFF